jgi:3-isopropylmalate/(R)-2-methylmalate dehydratase small subunit
MAGTRLLRARAVPLDMANVDTDCIIPARFLKQHRGPAYRDFLFHDRRFAADGARIAGFPIDDPAYAGARILVADANFGIGSAREGAVWALKEFGFVAVVASSFGDVFRENCVKNGLVPVAIGAEPLAAMRQRVRAAPAAEVTIDLSARTASLDAMSIGVPLMPFEQRLLLEGLDEIALTLSHLQQIEEFERNSTAVSLRIDAPRR